jgi:hypothetical protein
MWQCDTRKQQKLEDRKNGHPQLETGRSLHTIDINAREQEVGNDRNDRYRYGCKENMKISPNRRRDSRWGEDELDDLRHPRHKTDVLVQTPCRIIEYTPRPGYRASQLGIRKGKGDIQQDDQQRGDGHAHRPSLR